MWSEMGDREGNLESGGPGFTQRSMGAPGAVGPPTPGLWLFIPQPSPPHTLGSQRNKGMLNLTWPSFLTQAN